MKSLEERKADRAKRQEQAEADKETANEILRTGTGSQADAMAKAKAARKATTAGPSLS